MHWPLINLIGSIEGMKSNETVHINHLIFSWSSDVFAIELRQVGGLSPVCIFQSSAIDLVPLLNFSTQDLIITY